MNIMRQSTFIMGSIMELNETWRSFPWSIRSIPLFGIGRCRPGQPGASPVCSVILSMLMIRSVWNMWFEPGLNVTRDLATQGWVLAFHNVLIKSYSYKITQKLTPTKSYWSFHCCHIALVHTHTHTSMINLEIVIHFL